MSVTVVGSVAFDAVKTPFGSRSQIIGGAATHFALSAAFFTPVHMVGVVGDDFTEDEIAILQARGIDTTDIVRVPGGKTFFWEGEYSSNLNSRRTLRTELNVFADFRPTLSAAARNCEVLFLANIQPQLQLDVLGQCDRPRFTALDSMDLWIENEYDSLMEVVGLVDCLLLNDDELRRLTRKPNVVSGADALLALGLTAVVAKQGEYGACLFTQEGFFGMPAFPLREVVDPTGAGDTFAGGFLGCIAASSRSPVTHQLLVNAMTYGTVLASYNVEGFGPDRVLRLTSQEITDRASKLREMTAVEADLVVLGGTSRGSVVAR